MKVFLVTKQVLDEEQLSSENKVFTSKEQAEEWAKSLIFEELALANHPERCCGRDDDDCFPMGTILYAMDGEASCEIWAAGEAAEYYVGICVQELELD